MRNDVSRFQGGVSNTAPTDALASLGIIDPTKYSVFFNDFYGYTAADWVVTETQAGATQAVIAGNGGLLSLVNTAADNDVNAIQWAGGAGAVREQFRWSANKRLAVAARFSISDATNADVAIGLYTTDTSPIVSAPTDGIYFLKADDATTFVGRVGKDSSYTASSALGSVVASTMIEVAMVYEGIPRVDAGGTTFYDFICYVNGVGAGTVASTVATTPDDQDLAVSMVVQAGEAVAKTMNVDWILAAVER